MYSSTYTCITMYCTCNVDVYMYTHTVKASSQYGTGTMAHSMASVGMMLELNQVQLECYTTSVSSLYNQSDCPKI